MSTSTCRSAPTSRNEPRHRRGRKMVMTAINRPEFLRTNADGEQEQFLTNSVIAQWARALRPGRRSAIGGYTAQGRITVSFVKSRTAKASDRRRPQRHPRGGEGLPGCHHPRHQELRRTAAGTADQHRDHQPRIRIRLGLRRRHEAFIENTGIDGIEGLKPDVEKSKPEMPITIDRDKARRYGLAPSKLDMRCGVRCSAAKSVGTRMARMTTRSTSALPTPTETMPTR